MKRVNIQVNFANHFVCIMNSNTYSVCPVKIVVHFGFLLSFGSTYAGAVHFSSEMSITFSYKKIVSNIFIQNEWFHFLWINGMGKIMNGVDKMDKV